MTLNFQINLHLAVRLLDTINCRVLSEYFIPNLKEEDMLQFGNIPPHSQYDDILVSILTYLLEEI